MMEKEHVTEKTLDRRSFLKYAGVASAATLFTLTGTASNAHAQTEEVFGLLSHIPSKALNKLPEVLLEISEDDKAIEEFLNTPRTVLANHQIELASDQFVLTAIDYGPLGEESGELEGFGRVKSDPPFPFPEGITVGTAAVGFAVARVALIIRAII